MGNSSEELKKIPDNTFDSVVTDPPYGLSDTSPHDVRECLKAWIEGKEYFPFKVGFGNQQWDAWVPSPILWGEVLRVMKPGAHIVAFAGSRTYDLMTLSMRLSGFEIRDGLFWHYTTAQPRGLDISKAFLNSGDKELSEKYKGFCTTLKPSCEPIVLAQKPCVGTFADNVATYGTGALNIDAVRIGDTGAKLRSNSTNGGIGHGVYKGISKSIDRDMGRYPSNTLLTHSVECTEEGCIHECVVKAFSTQQGDITSDFWHTSSWDINIDFPFMFSPKATVQEKQEGLEHLPNIYNSLLGREESKKNFHPTVKPWKLMEWLVKCVTPPGGKILDPFGGSGTTGVAALKNGFDVTLIEKMQEYQVLIEGRLAHAQGTPIKAESKKQMKLF